jgi:hypothetical protein
VFTRRSGLGLTSMSTDHVPSGVEQTSIRIGNQAVYRSKYLKAYVAATRSEAPLMHDYHAKSVYSHPHGHRLGLTPAA